MGERLLTEVLIKRKKDKQRMLNRKPDGFCIISNPLDDLALSQADAKNHITNKFIQGKSLGRVR